MAAPAAPRCVAGRATPMATASCTAQQRPGCPLRRPIRRACAPSATWRPFRGGNAPATPLLRAVGAAAPLCDVSVDEEQPPRTTREPDSNEKCPDYYANVGDAIRTLREDVPALFERELNFAIYRDDICFRDPRNSFAGLKNYKLIFWSLRFHGRIFFKRLYVEVRRIWQPSDGLICMRWTVHGIPRVPWEAEGLFDGISQYKLDREGRIYEHAVDNVILRDPPMQGIGPLLAGLNLVPGTPQQPVPGAWFQPVQQLAQPPHPAQGSAVLASVASPQGIGVRRSGSVSGSGGGNSNSNSTTGSSSSSDDDEAVRRGLPGGSSVGLLSMCAQLSWLQLYAALLGTMQLHAGTAPHWVTSQQQSAVPAPEAGCGC